MENETSADAGVIAADVVEATVPDQVEQPAAADTPPDESRTFTQADVDRIVQARLRREIAKAERMQQIAAVRERILPTQVPSEPPARANYADEASYLNDAAAYRAAVGVQALNQVERVATVQEKFEERAEQFAATKPDFADKVYAENFPLSPVARDVVMESDIGPELVYHLASNLELAAKINALPPVRQAAELGRIEGELQRNKALQAAKKVPAPISPVTGKTTAVAADPLSVSRVTNDNVAAWIAARNKR